MVHNSPTSLALEAHETVDTFVVLRVESSLSISAKGDSSEAGDVSARTAFFACHDACRE